MIFLAHSLKMGWSLGSLLTAWYSSLKPILFPTKIFGTFPMFSVILGYHYFKIEASFCERWQKMKVTPLKNNQESIAIGITERLNRLYSSWPALSQSPKLTILAYTLTVAA
jgi:hypothetical protein